MPIYEYRCKQCGNEFEKLIRSISSQNIVNCEACGATDVDKLVSAFAFSGGGGFSDGENGGSSCASCSLPDCSSCK